MRPRGAALERGDLVAATARGTSAVGRLAADFPGRALAIRLDVRDEEDGLSLFMRSCSPAR